MKGDGSQETIETAARDSEGNTPGSGSGWSARDALSPGPARDEDEEDPPNDGYILHVRGDCSNGE